MGTAPRSKGRGVSFAGTVLSSCYHRAIIVLAVYCPVRREPEGGAVGPSPVPLGLPKGNGTPLNLRIFTTPPPLFLLGTPSYLSPDAFPCQSPREVRLPQGQPQGRGCIARWNHVLSHRSAVHDGSKQAVRVSVARSRWITASVIGSAITLPNAPAERRALAPRATSASWPAPLDPSLSFHFRDYPAHIGLSVCQSASARPLPPPSQ